MAIYALRMQVISRGGTGRSAVAAAAYRAGEKLVDPQGRVHDYTRKRWVEHTEILLPPDAPAWAHDMSRQDWWGLVENTEKRKDSQLARELFVNIPRELDKHGRIQLVRDFVTNSFTRHGMLADVCIHAPPASDGGINYHAHIMLSMRGLLSEGGFGPKNRHERVPSGVLRPDGKPIFIDSRESWNSLTMLDQTRLEWELAANKALEAVGSAARIDRRSYLERGIAKVAEPWLGPMLFHMRELRGAMKERFSQWQYVRIYRAAEVRAKAAFDRLERGGSLTGEVMRTTQRFHAWFDRQIENLNMRERPRDPSDRQPGMER